MAMNIGIRRKNAVRMDTGFRANPDERADN